MQIRSELFLIGLLAMGTFFSRVINLLSIPIFNDEASYIRFAQIGLMDSSYRYMSLLYGKQPLFIWLISPFLTVFSDPLFAGRFVSVLAGTFSVIGIYLVSKVLFGRKVGFFSSILYLFSPFSAIYDRLALFDSLLSCTIIWALYFQILLVTRMRYRYAILGGILSGLGLLTKSSAFFTLYLLPALIILFDFSRNKRDKKIVKLILSVVSIFVIGEVMFNSLRISPFFDMINQQNYVFILSFSQFLQSPFSMLTSNLSTMIPWIFSYLTVPLSIVILLAIVLGIIKRERKIFFLFVWFLFPFLSLASFGKILFPRYLLFMSIPLLIIAAFMLSEITKYLKNKWYSYILILVILIYPIYQTLTIMVTPVYADIPSTDKYQFFDGWTSGAGVKEIVHFLDEKSQSGNVTVATAAEQSSGLFPKSLEIYLKNNPNIEIYRFSPQDKLPDLLIEKSKTSSTYIVFRDSYTVPSGWPIRLVAKYRRGLGTDYVPFYEVISK